MDEDGDEEQKTKGKDTDDEFEKLAQNLDAITSAHINKRDSKDEDSMSDSFFDRDSKNVSIALEKIVESRYEHDGEGTGKSKKDGATPRNLKTKNANKRKASQRSSRNSIAKAHEDIVGLDKTIEDKEMRSSKLSANVTITIEDAKQETTGPGDQNKDITNPVDDDVASNSSASLTDASENYDFLVAMLPILKQQEEPQEKASPMIKMATRTNSVANPQLSQTLTTSVNADLQ